MQYGIAISNPCHVNWDAMTPETSGRHCAQCCKTVIDFTDWDTDEIAAYLAAKQYDSVCGRFKEDQLATVTITPETYIYELHQSNYSFFTKIAAVFIFVFCLSVNVDAQQPAARAVPQKMMGKPARVEQGQIAPVQQQPTKPGATIIVKGPDKADQMIMGGIRAYPVPDTGKVKGRVHTTPQRKK